MRGKHSFVVGLLFSTRIGEWVFVVWGSGVFPFSRVDFFLPVSGRGSCVWDEVYLRLLCTSIIFNTRAVVGCVRSVQCVLGALLLRVYFFLPISWVGSLCVVGCVCGFMYAGIIFSTRAVVWCVCTCSVD